MKLSRFLIDMKKLEAKHYELSDVPCELPITSWDYTGEQYEHMYLSTSVGRTRGRRQRPHASAHKGFHQAG